MRYLPAFLLLLVLPSCGPNYVYEENLDVDPSGWAYDDARTFQFSVTDTQQLYNLYLRFSHRPDFFSQNVYVNITTTFPGGEQVEEALSLQLANKFGQWFGDCSSESCTLEIPLQTEAFFNQLGPYSVAVEQWSREDPLMGVEAIGFALEALDQKRE